MEEGLTHETNLNIVIVKTQHDQDSIDTVNAPLFFFSEFLTGVLGLFWLTG